MLYKKLITLLCLVLATSNIYATGGNTLPKELDRQINRYIAGIKYVQADIADMLLDVEHASGYLQHVGETRRVEALKPGESLTEHPFFSMFNLCVIQHQSRTRVYMLGLSDSIDPTTKTPLLFIGPATKHYIHYYNGFLLTLEPKVKQIREWPFPRFVLNDEEFAHVMQLPTDTRFLANLNNLRPVQAINPSRFQKGNHINFAYLMSYAEHANHRIMVSGYRFSAGKIGPSSFILRPIEELDETAVPFSSVAYTVESNAIQSFEDKANDYYSTHPNWQNFQSVIYPPTKKGIILITYYKPVKDIDLLKFCSTNKLCPGSGEFWLDIIERFLQQSSQKALITLGKEHNKYGFNLESLGTKGPYLPVSDIRSVGSVSLEEIHNSMENNSILGKELEANFTYLERTESGIIFQKCLYKGSKTHSMFKKSPVTNVSFASLLRQIDTAKRVWHEWNDKAVFYFDTALDNFASLKDIQELKGMLRRCKQEFNDYHAVAAVNFPYDQVTEPTFVLDGISVLLDKSFGIVEQDGTIRLYFQKDKSIARSENALDIHDGRSSSASGSSSAAAAAREVFRLEDFPQNPINFQDADLSPAEFDALLQVLQDRLDQVGVRGYVDLKDQYILRNNGEYLPGRVLCYRNGLYSQFESSIIQSIVNTPSFITQSEPINICGLNPNGLDLRFLMYLLQAVHGIPFSVDVIQNDLLSYVEIESKTRISKGEENLGLSKQARARATEVIERLRLRVMYHDECVFIILYDGTRIIHVYRSNPQGMVEMEV